MNYKKSMRIFWFPLGLRHHWGGLQGEGRVLCRPAVYTKGANLSGLRDTANRTKYCGISF